MSDKGNIGKEDALMLTLDAFKAGIVELPGDEEMSVMGSGRCRGGDGEKAQEEREQTPRGDEGKHDAAKSDSKSAGGEDASAPCAVSTEHDLITVLDDDERADRGQTSAAEPSGDAQGDKEASVPAKPERYEGSSIQRAHDTVRYVIIALCTLAILAILGAVAWSASSTSADLHSHHREQPVHEAIELEGAERNVRGPRPLDLEEQREKLEMVEPYARWSQLELVMGSEAAGQLAEVPGLYRNDGTQMVESWYSRKVFLLSGIPGSSSWSADESGVVRDAEGLVIVAAPEEVGDIGDEIDTSLGRGIIQDRMPYVVAIDPDAPAIEEQDLKEGEIPEGHYPYIYILTEW